jgi:hypothetical protein
MKKTDKQFKKDIHPYLEGFGAHFDGDMVSFHVSFNEKPQCQCGHVHGILWIQENEDSELIPIRDFSMSSYDSFINFLALCGTLIGSCNLGDMIVDHIKEEKMKLNSQFA